MVDIRTLSRRLRALEDWTGTGADSGPEFILLSTVSARMRTDDGEPMPNAPEDKIAACVLDGHRVECLPFETLDKCAARTVAMHWRDDAGAHPRPVPVVFGLMADECSAQPRDIPRA